MPSCVIQSQSTHSSTILSPSKPMILAVALSPRPAETGQCPVSMCSQGEHATWSWCLKVPEEFPAGDCEASRAGDCETLDWLLVLVICPRVSWLSGPVRGTPPDQPAPYEVPGYTGALRVVLPVSAGEHLLRRSRLRLLDLF
eukprot:4878055-Prymnesium_polylepis.1